MINNVFGEIYDSSDDIKEIIENIKRSTNLKLQVTWYISFFVFKYKSWFSKQNERVEESWFNFVLKILCFDLQETKDRHNFADRNSRVWLEQIKQTRDIFLKIQFDPNWLEAGSWLFPDIHDAVVRQLFELVHFHEKTVHIFDALI